MNDYEWLKKWREDNKSALLRHSGAVRHEYYAPESRNEWDSLRRFLRTKYGDKQLERVELRCSR